MVDVAEDLTVGEHGVGTLQILDGGKVANLEDSYIGKELSSHGTVIVENATWEIGKRLRVGFFGRGLLEIRSGGKVSARDGAVIGSLGILRSRDRFTGNVENWGTAAPGNSTGTLTIEGDYTQMDTGRLEIELSSTMSFDKLAVTGQATLGGTLDIILLDGFMPSPSDSFEFLTAASFTGAFDNIMVRTAAGPAGMFELIPTPMGLILSNFQAAIGLTGDFNNDGKVDAADYVAWRNGLGSAYTPAHYDNWRANFGRTAGVASGTHGTIPEPTAPWMFLMGLAALGTRRLPATLTPERVCACLDSSSPRSGLA
jgi:T5SS/PEP-CTERM-associated repeat protein